MSDDGESILKIEYDNAQKRLTEQQDTLREFSNEGMTMFRLILLFIAAPIAILGALDPTSLGEVSDLITSNDCAIRTGLGCFRIFSVTGYSAFFLVFATLMHVLPAGYEARGIHNFTNPRDLANTRNSNQSLEEYLRARLRECETRIEENDKVIHVMEGMLGLGKFGVFASVIGIAILFFVLITESPVPTLWFWVIAILLLVFVLLAHRGLPAPYRKADRFISSSYSPVYGLETNEDNEE